MDQAVCPLRARRKAEDGLDLFGLFIVTNPEDLGNNKVVVSGMLMLVEIDLTHFVKLGLKSNELGFS